MARVRWGGRMGNPKCGQFHDIRSERYCLDCIKIDQAERLIKTNERANDLMEMKLEGYEQPRKERTRYQESTYKPPEPTTPVVIRREE